MGGKSSKPKTEKLPPRHAQTPPAWGQNSSLGVIENHLNKEVSSQRSMLSLWKLYLMVTKSNLIMLVVANASIRDTSIRTLSWFKSRTVSFWFSF